MSFRSSSSVSLFFSVRSFTLALWAYLTSVLSSTVILAAEFFTDRTDVQCLHRWQKVLNPDLVKGAWTKEEDDRIMELVNKYGAKKWSVIAQNLPGRIGKQCRERCAVDNLVISF